MATSFSGGRSLSTRREPPTMDKQLVYFITCGCESSAPFFSSPGPKVHVNYCHHLASVVCHPSSVNFTFQASSPKPLDQLEPNLAGMFLGWSATKFLFFVPVGYSTWLPRPTICSDWLKFQKIFSETNELTVMN